MKQCVQIAAYSERSVSLQCISSGNIRSYLYLCLSVSLWYLFLGSNVSFKHYGQNHDQIVPQKTLRQRTVLYSLKMSMNPFMKHVSMFHLSFSDLVIAGLLQSLLLLRSSRDGGMEGGYARVDRHLCTTLASESIPSNVSELSGMVT